MSVILELSDREAGVLQATAAAQGLSLSEWIHKLAQQTGEPPIDAMSRPARHISETICEIMSGVPTEQLAALRRDGAAQHNH